MLFRSILQNTACPIDRSVLAYNYFEDENDNQKGNFNALGQNSRTNCDIFSIAKETFLVIFLNENTL